MSIESLEQLKPFHIDVLTEIGNIGSGNAATALASMMNTVVDIEIPTITLLDYERVADLLGGADASAIGISLDITDDLTGRILHILQPDFASKLVNTFYPTEIQSLEDISDMDISVISEMGNITSAAYVNALAGLTNLFINISPPTTLKGTIETILSTSSTSMKSLGQQVLFIDERLKIGESEIHSSLILMLEIDSLKVLFDKLGVEY